MHAHVYVSVGLGSGKQMGSGSPHAPLQPQLIISSWLCEPCVASGFDFSKDADSRGVFLCKFAHFQMLARSFKNFCPNQTGRTCPWHVAFEAAACCSGTDHGCLMVLPGEEK